MAFFLWAILALVVGTISYFLYASYRDGKYFEDRGIVHFGNGMIQFLLMTIKGTQISDSLVTNYEKVKSKNQKFGGSMEFGKPTYFLVDLDLVKSVLVKDFDHFVDRRSFGNAKGNKIFGKMLVTREGEQWKALRSKMSPTFTTGKIRRMFSILDQSGKKMVKYLETEISKSAGVVDLADGFSKYTMDVIASVAFGLDSKAFNQTYPSVFEQMGAKIQFKFGGLAIVKFLISMASPKLADLLGISFMEPEAIDFFSGVIKSTIKYRGETDEKRDDFLQLMLEARAGQLKAEDASEMNEFEKEAMIVTEGQDEVTKVTPDLDDDSIVAQSVLFILGGFDTTQGLLLFAAYNLAIYPEIQESLFQEVQKSVEDNDGNLTYDSVLEMVYLDMFINETLRYYPPGIILERTCTKQYKIPDSDIIVEKGAMVAIPVYAIQMDPELFPEPKKFDPERFSPHNRSKIHPCAFIPFGAGPRNCIAMRLAMVEAKMIVAHLVLNFVFEPSEKTLIPMKFAKVGTLKPEGGMPLKLKTRKPT